MKTLKENELKNHAGEPTSNDYKKAKKNMHIIVRLSLSIAYYSMLCWFFQFYLLCFVRWICYCCCCLWIFGALMVALHEKTRLANFDCTQTNSNIYKSTRTFFPIYYYFDWLVFHHVLHARLFSLWIHLLFCAVFFFENIYFIHLFLSLCALFCVKNEQRNKRNEMK